MDKYFYSYSSFVHKFNNLVVFMDVPTVKDAVKLLLKCASAWSTWYLHNAASSQVYNEKQYAQVLKKYCYYGA